MPTPTRPDALSIHLRLSEERSAETARGAESMASANAAQAPHGLPKRPPLQPDTPPATTGPHCPCDLGSAARFSASLARACAAGELCGAPWQATRKR